MSSNGGSHPQRIGYVVKRYPRYSETFIVNEILAHEAAGLEIEIFALRPTTDTHFQNLISRVRAPLTYLPFSGIRAVDFWAALESASVHLPGFWNQMPVAQGEDAINVFQAAVLAQSVRQRGITHLHAHFATSATSVARLAARFAEIPFTFTAHAKDIFHESVVREELARKLNDAAGVVTVSEFNLRFLRDIYDEAASRVELIYNGVDLREFSFSSPEGRPAKIVSVGRLVEKKGFADLIDACSILAKRGCRFECVIVGSGELESDLRAQVASLCLDEYVRLAGSRPQSDVIDLVQSAAVFAAPCVVGADGNRDGLPTVLLEAMALGTPCVSTDVTGVPEVLNHEETGLMVSQHDPRGLADAMERLLRNSELRVRLARNARVLIEQKFEARRNAARLRKLFERGAKKVSVLTPTVREAAVFPEVL